MRINNNNISPYPEFAIIIRNLTITTNSLSFYVQTSKHELLLENWQIGKSKVKSSAGTIGEWFEENGKRIERMVLSESLSHLWMIHHCHSYLLLFCPFYKSLLLVPVCSSVSCEIFIHTDSIEWTIVYTVLRNWGDSSILTESTLAEFENS